MPFVANWVVSGHIEYCQCYRGCCGGYLSSRADLGYKVCCDSYRGRLRTIKVFWWQHGLAGCWVGLGHTFCYDGFRGRLRTTRMLWWQQGSDEDNKDGFFGHRNRLRTHTLM